MKVKQISTYQSSDGQTRWKVSFENDDKPLIMGWEPKLKEGDDVPDANLKVASKGDRQYYIWKREARRGYDRHSPDAEDWTTIRTALMQAVQLEAIYPQQKLDIAFTVQNARELFAGMAQMKPGRDNASNQ